MKGKYYLHCQVVAVFVMSEDELRENVPPEGDWRSDRTSFLLTSLMLHRNTSVPMESNNNKSVCVDIFHLLTDIQFLYFLKFQTSSQY